ncbi:hypothetical protein EYZ11_013361 [Aspergillus tanneri]|uniref:FAD-binding domain-containing protein n=1 Tax=Aspergillus tanneri TaxID=1220188 RepID=A0A4S3IXY5_9EURO|nr:uncharacterized protein ATNIH1004_006633 [Aspergillus tanneri]KAA8647931.1 hypothetical protein ATNIH1004_006633 [Aspergillus tanneri]THC87193.1 hypothetical protein EYZ11_013361 [Aspergillus tanneri]
MRDLALKENPTRPWDSQQPYTVTYQLLFGSFPSPSPAGQGYDVQSKGKAITNFSGPERRWFFLYKRLPKPTSERVDYTDEDTDAFAVEFAECPLTRTVKVKDVWPRMLGAGLTNLDEGIVKNWSFERIVLGGDSCHKMTTHLGLRFNHGTQDVVVLCNSLRKAIRAAPSGVLDTKILTALFERYQAVRMSSVRSLKGDYLAVPNVVEDLFMHFVMAPEFRKGQLLDYVAKEERMRGKIS